MAVLNIEAVTVQNSALGAGIIWRTVFAYQERHRTRDSLPLPLAFLVLPLLYHQDTFAVLSSTQRRTGLRGFAEKFTESKTSQSDLLFSVHDRALRWRSLSWRSVRIAADTRLVRLHPESASLIPLSTSNVRSVPNLVKGYMKNAEKLGEWFAELSLYEISTALRIVF